MDLQAHPRFRSLLASFGRRLAASHPWSGIVYRSVHPRHATGEDAASGRGSFAFGGRWNPPGSFAAVYASLDAETALAEALARIRREGFPDHQAMPRVFLALEVRLERTLDLSRTAILRSLRLGRRELLDADWRRLQESGREALPQAVGRAAFQAGLEGILVPSAGRRGGVNLVAMPENFGEDSWLTRLGA